MGTSDLSIDDAVEIIESAVADDRTMTAMEWGRVLATTLLPRAMTLDTFAFSRRLERPLKLRWSCFSD